MLGVRLYMAQRISAMVMVPSVIAHLAVMIYAIQGGLSADEILARTQGSVMWFLFYGIFVLAVSVHGAIGLRVIAYEWAGLRGRGLEALTWGMAALVLGLGLRAVIAVTL